MNSTHIDVPEMTFMATLDATNSWRPKLRGKYVVYFRASAKPYSRLSIKAQKKAVAALIEGAPARQVGEFVELEPLLSSSRPALERAIAACKSQNASLVIGKLDRMRGMVGWLQQIHEQKVRVFAADIPHFCRGEFWRFYNNRHGWRIAMSRSVKEGLARTKSEGTELGGRRGDPQNLKLGPAKSLEVRRAKAKRRDKATVELINNLQERGVKTFVKIAERLNQMDHKAPRGGPWSPAQVRRFIEKYSA
jgi:DNA invertase Pin-like site-specific DNA recombinase